MSIKQMEPEERPGMFEGDRRFSHPAYGQLQVSRIYGSAPMYGSDFVHHSYIEINLHTSEMQRHHAQDSYFADKTLFRIRMSAAQWAEFVSSFNVGSGVPVTIEYTQEGRMPEIVHRDAAQEFASEGSETISKATSCLDDLLADIEKETGLSAKRKEALLDRVRRAHCALSDNLPFVEQQFGKHLETRMAKAKAEYHAYVNHAVVQAGLDAIAGAKVLSLPEPVGVEEGEHA